MARIMAALATAVLLFLFISTPIQFGVAPAFAGSPGIEDATKTILNVARTERGYQKGVEACAALKKLGSRANTQAAVDALIEALHCKARLPLGNRTSGEAPTWNIAFRHAALTALRSAGARPQVVVPALIECLKRWPDDFDDYWTEYDLFASLVYITDDDVNFRTISDHALLRSGAFRGFLREMLDYLASLGPKASEALPVLVDITSGNAPHPRSLADEDYASELSSLGLAPFGAKPDRVYETYVPFAVRHYEVPGSAMARAGTASMKHGPWLRREAEKALGKIVTADQLIPTLIEQLRTSKEARVRRCAAEALAKLTGQLKDNKRMVLTALAAASKDPNPGVREMAARASRHIKGESDGKWEPGPQGDTGILLARFVRANDERWVKLVGQLDAPAGEIRNKALHELNQLARSNPQYTQSVRLGLECVLRDHADVTTRLEAADLVTGMPHDLPSVSGVKYIGRELRNPKNDLRLRTRAATILGRFTWGRVNVEAVKELVAVLESKNLEREDPDRELHFVIVRSLANVAGLQGLDRTCKQAIECLAKTRKLAREKKDKRLFDAVARATQVIPLNLDAFARGNAVRRQIGDSIAANSRKSREAMVRANEEYRARLQKLGKQLDTFYQGIANRNRPYWTRQECLDLKDSYGDAARDCAARAETLRSQGDHDGADWYTRLAEEHKDSATFYGDEAKKLR